MSRTLSQPQSDALRALARATRDGTHVIPSLVAHRRATLDSLVRLGYAVREDGYRYRYSGKEVG